MASFRGAACGTSDAEREPMEEDSSKEPYDSPNILRRHVVASRREVKLFGPHLASEVWRLGFMHAEKGAFVGDGSEAILQLVADQLSDHSPLESFWTRRENQANGVRRHR